MDQKTGMRLLSKRNILGAVLIAGIATGVYLSDYLKGWGLGGGPGISGSNASKGTLNTGADSGDDKNTAATVDSTPNYAPDESVAHPPQVLKVVVADRSFFIRETGEVPELTQVDLKQIVRRAKAATGDDDGIRVRVYRKSSSRASVEVELRDALVAAGITEDQTVWVATPIED